MQTWTISTKKIPTKSHFKRYIIRTH